MKLSLQSIASSILSAAILLACGGSSAPVGKEQAAAACVAIRSCGDEPTNCLENLFEMNLTADQISCAAATKSCPDTLACIGITITPDPDCTPGRSCDENDIFVRCTDGVVTRADCAARAESSEWHCVVGTAGAQCGVETCDANGSSCNGTQLLTCDDNVLKSFDCAKYGLSCRQEGAVAWCSDGIDASCTPGTQPYCDNGLLVSCDNSRETRFDCGKFPVKGLACITIDENSFCGFNDKCTPGSNTSICTDNTSLSTCVGGEQYEVNCIDLGFSSCGSDTLGNTRCI